MKRNVLLKYIDILATPKSDDYEVKEEKVNSTTSYLGGLLIATFIGTTGVITPIMHGVNIVTIITLIFCIIVFGVTYVYVIYALVKKIAAMKNLLAANENSDAEDTSQNDTSSNVNEERSKMN